MQITETSAFKCPDGAVFFTRSEAEAYMSHVAAVSQAQGYADALRDAGFGDGTVTRRIGVIVKYLEWRDKGVLDTPPPAGQD